MIIIFVFLLVIAILIGGLGIMYAIFSPQEKQKQELYMKWMMENARVMEAPCVGIDSGSPSDDVVYRLVCEADDLRGGKKKYYSQWLTENPEPFMAPYKTFTVRVNPRNADDYIFTVPWQLLQFVKK